ncbi:MAG: efflux transporter periplasmic adaptor subunit, partial [Bradyrhizobium sp.]|nr:efflux transporter periplasmic adaptor subunit [Bradyrhizobium sp.]
MAVLFGGLYGFQTFKGIMIAKAIGAMANPPQTVSTVTAETAPWRTNLTAVGSLRAVNGADLALQVAGIVQSIQFNSGDSVEAGQPLLQL